jgi:hypothetical protein
MPAAKRAFILYGVAANKYYTFGVRAYRKVDTDISSTGLIFSDIIKSSVAGENPYQPSSTVAFAGNITGTVNNIPVGQVNVWENISSTGGNKPQNGADVTANNTAAGIAGQGALATANHVFVGSTVKFADGSILNTVDFVNKLAKIGTGNIGTFVDGLAITDAYIGNAAIKSAKIDNLAVTTIKIGNDQVTIPRVVTASDTVVGNGTNHTILTKTFTLTSLGTVYAHATVGINLGSGARYMELTLKINGTTVSSIAGNAETYGLSIGGALEGIAAGTSVTVEVIWNGTAGSSAYTRSLFVQGAMK